MKVVCGVVNFGVRQLPLFYLLGPEHMNGDDFQCVQGRRGLNTNRSSQKFALLGDDNVIICIISMLKPQENGRNKTTLGMREKVITPSNGWGKTIR